MLLVLALPLLRVLAYPPAHFETWGDNEKECICYCPPIEYYESIECGAQYLNVYYDPCECCGEGPAYLIHDGVRFILSIPYYEYDEFKRMCHLESWSLFGPTEEIPPLGILEIIEHILCLLDPRYC